MAEVKNSFLGSKMNKDLDDRLIPNNEYRDALNISIGKSEGDSIGVAQTSEGNLELTQLGGAQFETMLGLTCIGYFSDAKNNRIYQFLTNYTDNVPTEIILCDSPGNSQPIPVGGWVMKITVYDPAVSPVYRTLVSGTFLNFSKTNIITGVNLVEDLLFFTDNRNQPRKINVTKAFNNPNYYYTETQISVAKYAPIEPISLIRKETATVVSGTVGGADYVLSNVSSLACTIGAVGGPVSGPYTAIITTAIPDGFSEFFIGDVIAGNNGTGSFGAGPVIITGLIGSTSVQVSSKNIFSAGTASITLRYLYEGAIQSGATVLSSSSTGAPFLTGDYYAFVKSINNTTLSLYEPTTEISPTYILTFLNSTMSNQAGTPGWPGDPSFIEDKFVRFSYRFKFDDNEYSLLAPFTQIAYIPKQKGYFIDGNEANAYQSTVINWFENNINNIELLIPFPDKCGLVSDSYKITDLEILYKESDATAAYVIDSIPVNSKFGSISNSNIYTYSYQSQKPYKTLSPDQITRVYDNVPTRALGQEVSGNRVIYGNFHTTYVAPREIDYNTSVTPKQDIFDSFIEYPNHTLKQNRNYQVGFVLSDKFGRSSSVILSSVDAQIAQGTATSLSIGGSTLYAPYQAADQANFPDVREWFGNALTLLVNKEISSIRNIPKGTPGMYAIPASVNGFSILTGATINVLSGVSYRYGFTLNTTPGVLNTVPVIGQYLRGKYTDYVKVTNVTSSGGGTIYNVFTEKEINNLYLFDPAIGGLATKYAYTLNEIGWYSYKVVVKQQQQDYYNVYLPGMLQGYPEGQTYGSQVVYTGVTTVYTVDIPNVNWSSGSTVITLPGGAYTTSLIKTGDAVSGILPSPNAAIVTQIINTTTFAINQTPSTSGSFAPITVFRAPSSQSSSLENGINTTTFPIGELQKTSHIVLINDNINKVPRDLAEVGPDQKQYRSSVQLFGKVQNKAAIVNLISNTTINNALADTLTYDTTLPANAGASEIRIGDSIQNDGANTPIPSVPATIPATTMPNPARWYADTVVTSHTIVGTTGTIKWSPTNITRDSTNPVYATYVNFTFTRAENGQYFPTRKGDTVSSIATANDFNFIANDVTNIKGTSAVNFYQLQTNPLIGRVSTVNPIGVPASKMIPFLSVYETTPDVSALALFWETATTGIISDLNWDIVTGFDGPSRFSDFVFEFWEDQDPAGLNPVTGASDSKYITDPFSILNATGLTLAFNSINITDVTPSPGINLSKFALQVLPGNQYRLYITDPPGNPSYFVFNSRAATNSNFTFTITADLDGVLYPLYITGRLKNRPPSFLLPSYQASIQRVVGDIITMTAQNGSAATDPQLKIQDLSWEIINGNNSGYFTIGANTGLIRLVDPSLAVGSYPLEIRVSDAMDIATNPPTALTNTNPDLATKTATITAFITVGDTPVNPGLEFFDSTYLAEYGAWCYTVDPSITSAEGQSFNCLVPGTASGTGPGYPGVVPGQGICAAYVGTQDVSLTAPYTGINAIAGNYVTGFPLGRNIKLGTKFVVSGSGSLGTGSIVGYSNPTTYYVVEYTPIAPGVINYKLGLAPSGPAVTINAGTLNGLTFTGFDVYGGKNPNLPLLGTFGTQIDWQASVNVEQFNGREFGSPTPPTGLLVGELEFLVSNFVEGSQNESRSSSANAWLYYRQDPSFPWQVIRDNNEVLPVGLLNFAINSPLNPVGPPAYPPLPAGSNPAFYEETLGLWSLNGSSQTYGQKHTKFVQSTPGEYCFVIQHISYSQGYVAGAGENDEDNFYCNLGDLAGVDCIIRDANYSYSYASGVTNDYPGVPGPPLAATAQKYFLGGAEYSPSAAIPGYPTGTPLPTQDAVQGLGSSIPVLPGGLSQNLLTITPNTQIVKGMQYLATSINFGTATISNAGTLTVTLTGATTEKLVAGMLIEITGTAGAGLYPAGTVITGVVDSTHFTVNNLGIGGQILGRTFKVSNAWFTQPGAIITDIINSGTVLVLSINPVVIPGGIVAGGKITFGFPPAADVDQDTSITPRGIVYAATYNPGGVTSHLPYQPNPVNIKQFFTDPQLATPWHPPVANQAYNFICDVPACTRNGNLSGLKYSGGFRDYTHYPYFSAFFDANGNIIPQAVPANTVITGWGRFTPASQFINPAVPARYDTYNRARNLYQNIYAY